MASIAENGIGEFTSYLHSLETETRVLKSVQNIRNVNDKELKNKLLKLERTVEKMEESGDKFEKMLDEEMVVLNENHTALNKMAKDQQEWIAKLQGELPEFLQNAITSVTRELLYRPITINEFNTVPVSTRCRLTFENINESYLEIYKALSEKHQLMSCEKSKKKLNKATLLEYEKLSHVEHRGEPFVTEQELRSTKIFGSGESTGRSVLHTLRACGRLRVVRSSGENTFVLA